jgi:hypothetical protein
MPLPAQPNDSLEQIHRKELDSSTKCFIWAFSIISSLNIAIGKCQFPACECQLHLTFPFLKNNWDQKYPWRAGGSNDQSFKNSVDLRIYTKVQDSSSDEDFPVGFVESPVGFVMPC